MKKLLTILFILFGMTTIVACKDDTPIDDNPVNNGELIDFGDTFVEKTSIKVWMDDENGEYMAEVIKEFNKIYPDIFVEFTHSGSVDSREALKTFGPSGNGADVFQFPHDHLAQAVLEDLIYPLPVATQTVLAQRANALGLSIATLTYDETNGSFDPASANAVERLYAVPMSVESVGLFYNTDLITTPATTFESLFTFADTWNATVLTDGSGRTNAGAGFYALGTSSHWADSYFMQPIYSAFGFYPFGPNLNDPNTVGFETTPMINALNWIETSLKPRVTGTGIHNSVQANANFETGKIPYIIAGPWNHEAYKNAGLNYAVAPMPTINGNETKTFAGAMMAAVYKYSENVSDAIKFVEFLNSDIAMQLQYEYKGKLPALKTELLANIEGVNDDANLMAMAAQLSSAIPMPTIPQVTYYWGPGETMLIDVWNNNIDPAVAAATAEASYRARVDLAD